MSNPTETATPSISEFQAHFGTPPGAQDAAGECKKWAQLCAEVIADRDRLRAELAKTQAERDAYLKSVYHLMCKDYVCPYTKEELFAMAVYEGPTLRELIAEL